MAPRALDHYLRAQQVADRQLARLLLAAAEDAERRVLQRAGTRISDQVTRAQLTLVSAELRKQVVELWPDVDNVVRQGMVSAAEAAADAENVLTRTLYNAAGVPAAEMAAAVRQQARQGAENLYSRKVAGKTLSQRVYRTSVGAQGMIQGAINKALAQGASWKRLAGDVKGLINPRVPGGVSYAAERLARTEMNNAFHETQKRSAKDNPFITAMKWHLSSSHPEADICDSYAHDDHEGMGEGVFSKGNVPSKPHPQDLCYLTPEVVDEDEFVRKFRQGEYTQYLDEVVEGLPVPMPTRAIGPNTDELGQFVLQGREAGKSWAQIATEAKSRGLTNTSSPGAMRAIARKHGITDTGALKKGAKVVKDPPPVVRRPEPPRPKVAAPEPVPTGFGRGHVSRHVDEDVFEEFDGWNQDYVRALKVKYQELSDQYDMRYPGVRGDLNTDKRYGWLDDYRDSHGIHEGMSNQIWLNDRIFAKHTIESARAEWKRSERSGWFSKTGDSQELRTFVHEFGHAVEKNLSSTQLDGIFEKLYTHFTRGGLDRPVPYKELHKTSGLKVKPTLGRADVFVTRWARVMEKFRIEIQGQLSTYGTENWMEFIAEAFAEYKLSPKPRAISKIVGKAIDDALVLVD